MKLPYRVWVKGKVYYLIVWVDRFTNDTADEITRGECCADAKHIYLRKGLSEKETLETFVHELFHAIEFEYKLPIPHKLVYKLEKVMVNLLVKNGVKLQWEGQ